MSSRQFQRETVFFEFLISKSLFRYEIELFRFVIFEFVVNCYQQL